MDVKYSNYKVAAKFLTPTLSGANPSQGKQSMEKKHRS
jgi:hypothetical protein